MKVVQFKPHLDLSDYESIKDSFVNNWVTEGPKSKLFVEKLCKLMGVKYGVLAPNGTLALYLALRAMGIGKNDEVIIPNFTFIASANAVEMVGATPIFCDIKEDLQIDIDTCKELISEKTKAIMPVHIYGMASNMDEVVTFATEYKLKIIEDAAQGIGVKWKNRHVGTFGSTGCFSFFADKTITTGEGGFVCTNDKTIYTKLQLLRNQGRIHRGTFIHDDIGYNFRMTDIQSSVGLNQLKKLPYIITQKKTILDLYNVELGGMEGISIVKPDLNSTHIPFRVALIVDGGSKELMNYLGENDIEVRTFFYPLNEQYFYKKNKSSLTPITTQMFNEGICLPSYPTITPEEIKYVCQKIKEYVRETSPIL